MGPRCFLIFFVDASGLEKPIKLMHMPWHLMRVSRAGYRKIKMGSSLYWCGK